jgi:hypothetical protein
MVSPSQSIQSIDSIFCRAGAAECGSVMMPKKEPAEEALPADGEPTRPVALWEISARSLQGRLVPTIQQLPGTRKVGLRAP